MLTQEETWSLSSPLQEGKTGAQEKWFVQDVVMSRSQVSCAVLLTWFEVYCSWVRPINPWSLHQIPRKQDLIKSSFEILLLRQRSAQTLSVGYSVSCWRKTAGFSFSSLALRYAWFCGLERFGMNNHPPAILTIKQHFWKGCALILTVCWPPQLIIKMNDWWVTYVWCPRRVDTSEMQKHLFCFEIGKKSWLVLPLPDAIALVFFVWVWLYLL